MTSEIPPTSKVNRVSVDDLNSSFISLRIGEKIAKFEVKEIRKITNPSRQDNLSKVNYRYILESTEGKLLTVNSWVLWREISAALRQARTIQAVLELEHIDFEKYEVKVLDSNLQNDQTN